MPGMRTTGRHLPMSWSPIRCVCAGEANNAVLLWVPAAIRFEVRERRHIKPSDELLARTKCVACRREYVVVYRGGLSKRDVEAA